MRWWIIFICWYRCRWNCQCQNLWDSILNIFPTSFRNFPIYRFSSVFRTDDWDKLFSSIWTDLLLLLYAVSVTRTYFSKWRSFFPSHHFPLFFPHGRSLWGKKRGKRFSLLNHIPLKRNLTTVYPNIPKKYVTSTQRSQSDPTNCSRCSSCRRHRHDRRHTATPV